jgi:single-stranded-DNA-specific exonuclease
MNWKLLPKIEKNITTELSEYPSLIKQLLFNRGIETRDEAQKFLNPNIKNLYNPLLLADIDKAVDVIKNVITNKMKVFIYGDYDVDGVVATTILWDYLFRKLGIDVLPYIPSRFEEGYGLSEAGLNYIVEQGGQLVITVDCGIRDIEIVKKFKDEKNLDFIITDHHTLRIDEDEKIVVSNDALAVIHPRHPDSKYPFPDICGAAVAWKFVCAINEKLEGSKIQNLRSKMQDFDPVEEYLDLVSLATITDIMPLTDENRTIVSLGIEKMKNTKNLGLRTLIAESQINFEDINTYHYGYVIGPRLNAAGRMEHALDAARLLSTTKYEKALEYSQKLSRLNSERQTLTSQILDEAIKQIELNGNGKKIHFVWGENWPEGIVGLVAGKLQERFFRPILVASIREGLVVGSARSIPNFNVTEAITRSASLLIKFGGHSQAAGFTLSKDNLNDFKKQIEDLAEEQIKEEDMEKEIIVDTDIKIKDINLELVSLINTLQPFGYGNRTPVFIIKNCKVVDKFPLGKETNHVKLKVVDEQDNTLEVVAFDMKKELESVEIFDCVDLAGVLDLNTWNGRTTVQFRLKELKITNE